MPIFITICALFILLGFEIRHQAMAEDFIKLVTRVNILEEEISGLKKEMKMKKNIYDEHNPASK